MVPTKVGRTRVGRTKRKPRKVRKVRKYPLEKTIQKEVLSALEAAGVLHWRQNSGFIFVGRRRINLGGAGLPDIIIVRPDGRLVGLELKTKVGRQSDSQKLMERRFQASCAWYHIARSLEQAQQILLSIHGIQI
jgi:hypothetical protein